MASIVERHFDRILAYIFERTGIKLPETKYRALSDYLSKVGDDEDFARFTDFVEGPGADGFMDAVTINETYFFREQRHFALLRSGLLSELAARPALRNGPVKIWSAACSSGEEAVSLAALAQSVLGTGKVDVYASDIHPHVLEKFRLGTYSIGSLRTDGGAFHQILEPFIKRGDKDFQVGRELLGGIHISCGNLTELRYPGIPDDLDLVFMRNVLMYMPMETRHRIVGRVSAKLVAGGCLFVSSSEIPHLAHQDLLLVEKDGSYFFRKKGLEEKCKGILVSDESFRGLAGQAVQDPPSPPSLNLPSDPLPSALAAKSPFDKNGNGQDIARLATLRLNNPLFCVPDEPDFDAAVYMLEAVYRLNSGNLDALEEFIGQGEKSWGISSVSACLRGLAASALGKTDTAEKCFKESIALDKVFWPSMLRRALILKDRSDPDRNDRAAAEFEACAKSIEGYIERDEYHYQFLLEGFNAKYFLDLCRGWIRKLRSGGAGHGA